MADSETSIQNGPVSHVGQKPKNNNSKDESHSKNGTSSTGWDDGNDSDSEAEGLTHEVGIDDIVIDSSLDKAVPGSVDRVDKYLDGKDIGDPQSPSYRWSWTKEELTYLFNTKTKQVSIAQFSCTFIFQSSMLGSSFPNFTT